MEEILLVDFFLCTFAGSKPVNQSQCSARPLQHPSHYYRSYNDAGHQRSCVRYVSIRQEDGCTCNS